MTKSKDWPAWFNGPDGESEIFHSADEVPHGWTSGAEKRKAETEKPAKVAKPAKAETPLDL